MLLQFLEYFRGHAWGHFLLNMGLKVGDFFERFLQAPGSHVGGLFGLLGALSMGVRFQNPSQNISKRMFSKKLVFAILAFLACFLGAMLADFGLFWTP